MTSSRHCCQLSVWDHLVDLTANIVHVKVRIKKLRTVYLVWNMKKYSEHRAEYRMCFDNVRRALRKASMSFLVPIPQKPGEVMSWFAITCIAKFAKCIASVLFNGIYNPHFLLFFNPSVFHFTFNVFVQSQHCLPPICLTKCRRTFIPYFLVMFFP